MIVDVNVSLSRWPFRRLNGDQPAALVAGLRKRKVTQAWAGSFDGVFHKDIAGANARLASDVSEKAPTAICPVGAAAATSTRDCFVRGSTNGAEKIGSEPARLKTSCKRRLTAESVKS